MQRVVDRVSFIIPAYNASEFLQEALQSVLTQDYSDIEVIVVDDGSSDQSFEIASNYSDARVRAIRQANAGPSAARNTGFRHSTGEFIWYLDADDLLVDGCLPRLLDALRINPDAAFAVGGWRTTNVEGEDSSGLQHVPVGVTARELYLQMLLRTVFPVGSAVFRVSAVEASGGWDENLWCAEDRDFYLRVLDSSFQFKRTEIDVFRYRIHESNATFNTERIQKHANRFLEKWFGPQGTAKGCAQSLGPLAKAIVDLYIARQYAITNQSPQVLEFTRTAAESLLLAKPDISEVTHLLWETATNPHQKLVRASLWKSWPDIVSGYCNQQAKIALRAGKPFAALIWLTESIFSPARLALAKFGRSRRVKMLREESGPR